MSWLESLEYEHNFECKRCGSTAHIMSHDRPETPICETCRECADPGCEKCQSLFMSYKGFTPIKMGGTTRIEYEKNGVKAWRIQDSEGNVRHVSKMAENYYNTARVQSQNTRAYNDKVMENTSREFRKYKKELDSQAKVSTAKKGDE